MKGNETEEKIELKANQIFNKTFDDLYIHQQAEVLDMVCKDLKGSDSQ